MRPNDVPAELVEKAALQRAYAAADDRPLREQATNDGSDR